MAEAEGTADKAGAEGAEHPEAEDQGTVDAADLDAQRTEDEGKSDEQLWAEMDVADGIKPANGEAGAAEEATAPQDSHDGEADKAGEKAGEDAAKSAGAKPAAADIWKDIPEANRNEFQATRSELDNLKRQQHLERSSHGREIAALRREISELKSGRGASDKGAAADGKSKTTNGAATDGAAASDKWKGFASEYPEVAGPVEGEISALRSELKTLKERQDAERLRAQVDEQVSLLESKHPDWQTVTATEDYAKWLASQPKYVQEAVVRNADQIVDADEAADIISRFKASGSSPSQGAGQERLDGKDAAGGTGTALADRRRRQLESASGTRSKGPGPATGIPEDGDEEAIWRAFDAEDARKAARA